jgi:hypothetical protein
VLGEEERREWIDGLSTGARLFLLVTMMTMRCEDDENYREG